MEKHLKTRPKKKAFPLKKQTEIRKKAIKEIEKRLLPDSKIIKIVLMGSSVKGTFGEYEPPGFRNSLFSDFDFIIFVKDDYTIPNWLRREPSGKPFSKDELNLAYRNPKIIDEKYDFEMFFIRESSLRDPKIVKEAEEAGIPISNKSSNKHLVIYPKEMKSSHSSPNSG